MPKERQDCPWLSIERTIAAGSALRLVGPPLPRPQTGRRRAVKPARSRFRRLPSLPTIAGLAALVIAGAGAITVGHQQPADSAIALSAQGRQLSGTDAVGYVGGPRAARAEP